MVILINTKRGTGDTSTAEDKRISDKRFGEEILRDKVWKKQL